MKLYETLLERKSVPEITATALLPSRKKVKAVQSKPVQDRLYEQEQRRIDKLAKTKEMIECQEMEQCSFRPKLSVSKFRSKFETKLADREPIWKRQDIISKQNATKKM